MRSPRRWPATNNGYTNTRDSAHDYETSGETNDWSYYATRGFGFTQELIGPVAGCPQALPNYLNCTTADWTGNAGPTSTAAQTSASRATPCVTPGEHPLRVAPRRALADHRHRRPGRDAEGHEGLHALHHRIATTNSATGGGPTTPPRVPTHLESSMTVPASGKFTWDPNPSVRPQSAYYADGEHTGPNGFVYESYTLTCTAADGTVLGTTKVLVDKGDVANVTPCTSGGAGGTVPATLALTLGRRPRSAPSRRHRQGLHGDHVGQRDLHRR